LSACRHDTIATVPNDDRKRRGSVVKYSTPRLKLNEIQGDLLVGMHKNAELFLFFKITDAARFKAVVREYVVGLLTHGQTVQVRERMVEARRHHRGGGHGQMPWLGMNLGFTKDGLTQLLGAHRPQMDPAFERGADDPETIAALNDLPPSQWVSGFRSDRVDGVFLIAGPNKSFVTSHSHSLRGRLGTAIKTIYSEIGMVRPGRERGHEHFGFKDGISQPGIRGMTPVLRPSAAPEQGLPGQDLLWPGEFVLGYPGQDPRDPVRLGPIAPLPAPWAKNGSYMVFRRLEQKVPEFWTFVREQATRLGMDRELLAARMVGRWKSGAPLELAPLRDNPALGADPKRNNDFDYRDDPFQRKCPYAAHIRKANPRDDTRSFAEVLRHRIIRAAIPFGPEVEPGETTTQHSRGLMFVCYQTSIERQFEFIQRHYANNPDFVGGKERPGGGAVTPGFDPIIGQAPGGGARVMDEPAPNYPAGSRRTTLETASQFVTLTAAAYFFMPSISALRTVLTA
jgi:Dyp-type peroxidase family